MEIVNVMLVILLILLTAFFVASEYSIIRVRVSRINQLADQGNKNAQAVKRILGRLDEFLSASQLGTTLTSLALGWLGESTVEELLAPVFVWLHIPGSVTGILSFLLAFLILTYFEVLIGELVPKTVAIQVAEPLALALARPLIIFYRITYPFNWILSRSSRVISGLFGLKPLTEGEAAQSEAELRLALSEGFKSGEITPTEYRYLNNVFDFDERDAQEIMVPRTEIRHIPQDADVRDLLELIEPKTYSLVPVSLDGDKDHIVGMVNVKQVLSDYVRRGGGGPQPIAPYIRPVIQVIETVRARDLLGRMQKEGIHMSVLMDEYGGTSGLVTLEDLLEEIVGDIPSGSSPAGAAVPTPLIRPDGEGRFLLSSKALLHDVNRQLGTDIDSEEVYTIGGWLLSEKFDLKQGDTLNEAGWDWTIREMQGGRIGQIEAVRAAGNEREAEPN
ncbi:hemolysin family protein [Saccharibacillus alkalitolerans]|uniref:HlyC/CorC family transporter n=1 Tax=Saccharibacillus alkalitolerans TaxID=2705290 RepID=A0ABX0FED4_9BACL|nr:hemolysin family protein [Saccharibacillus alkalitolerans]NGZ77817.1 HlyC/CorC family transporter [Saccharibacillus alkalitolerans]